MKTVYFFVFSEELFSGIDYITEKWGKINGEPKTKTWSREGVKFEFDSFKRFG